MNNNNLNIDMETRSLLEKGGLEEPSSCFTNNVMKMIASAEKPLLAGYTPVISKKGWLLISGLMSLLIVVFIITGSMDTGSPNTNTDYAFEIGNNINSLTRMIYDIFTSIPLYILFAPIVTLIFFGFDKLLRKIISKES